MSWESYCLLYEVLASKPTIQEVFEAKIIGSFKKSVNSYGMKYLKLTSDIRRHFKRTTLGNVHKRHDVNLLELI